MLNEIIQFCFGFCPYQNYIVYVPKPHHWLGVVGVYKRVLKPAHKVYCKAGGYPCAHACSPYLEVMLAIKLEVVLFKNKLEEVDEGVV